MITKTPIHCRDDLARAFELDMFLPCAFCTVCNCTSEFVIDFDYSNQFIAYRESARCIHCNLVARQRVVLTRARQCIRPGDTIYLQEQVTNSYKWAITNFPDCTVIGSEYMPENPRPNIRHEDVENLSFDNCSIDVIISQDVFEHVAHPWQGFRECYRVLNPGGRMLMTIPFAGNPTSNTVDRLQQGLPAVYHGNPLSDKGSFVYSDFGWDIVQRLEQTGFSVDLAVYRSSQFGCPGPVLLFELIKPT